MPHFGLMDDTKLAPAEAALLRARLHWRGGKRRISQNKRKAGIATLWDAVLSAARYYHLTELAQHGTKQVDVSTTSFDDVVVLRRLAEEGRLGDMKDFKFLEKISDTTVMGGEISDDLSAALVVTEAILTNLGILPFDESCLPSEDPATF